MSIDRKMLRDKIRNMYGTNKKFSEVMGWKNDRVGRMLNGNWVPNINHCFHIMEALELTREEYYKIFLPASIPVQKRKSRVYYLNHFSKVTYRLNCTSRR